VIVINGLERGARSERGGRGESDEKRDHARSRLPSPLNPSPLNPLRASALLLHLLLAFEQQTAPRCYPGSALCKKAQDSVLSPSPRRASPPTDAHATATRAAPGLTSPPTLVVLLT
jgi:hypothetical protein